MEDSLTDMDFRPRPTADRPLLGLTVMVVEDSRYASEALRLMCLRSGARIRRADCVTSAERHLNVYRPSVAIVDLGLPDGSGADLVTRMDQMRPRVPILLGTSGEDADQAAALFTQAGADGFLAKPLGSLAAFQAAILYHIPTDMRPRGLAVADLTEVEPDRLSLREDLAHALDLLEQKEPPVGYLRRFLVGIARSARDQRLADRADALDRGIGATDQAALRALLSKRIAAVPEVV